MGGGAPATIQTDIIGPASATGILHAVLLTGGSAFGLAAYSGVMRPALLWDAAAPRYPGKCWRWPWVGRYTR